MSNRLTLVKKQRFLRKNRLKARIRGTDERPRLSVVITNQHVSAQIIDDDKHVTIASSTTVGKKSVKGSMTERAQWVGEDIAKKAKAKKVQKVSLDRGSKLYHGRVKALAEKARESGLEF